MIDGCAPTVKPVRSNRVLSGVRGLSLRHTSHYCPGQSAITPCWTMRIWRLNLNQSASGKAGAVQNEWCCKRGLNSRPLPYQGSALPLSYCSTNKALGPQPQAVGARLPQTDSLCKPYRRETTRECRQGCPPCAGILAVPPLGPFSLPQGLVRRHWPERTSRRASSSSGSPRPVARAGNDPPARSFAGSWSARGQRLSTGRRIFPAHGARHC